jgi:hypothetical protein
MSQRLTQFLIELSQDPLKRELFDRDPEGAMTAAGLGIADQNVILARDAAKVRAHFGVKTLAHMTCEEDCVAEKPPKKTPKKKVKKPAKKTKKPAKKK